MEALSLFDIDHGTLKQKRMLKFCNRICLYLGSSNSYDRPVFCSQTRLGRHCMQLASPYPKYPRCALQLWEYSSGLQITSIALAMAHTCKPTPTPQQDSCRSRQTAPNSTPQRASDPSGRSSSGHSKSPRKAARSAQQKPAGPTTRRSWCRLGSGQTPSPGCRGCAWRDRLLGRVVFYLVVSSGYTRKGCCGGGQLTCSRRRESSATAGASSRARRWRRCGRRGRGLRTFLWGLG